MDLTPARSSAIASGLAGFGSSALVTLIRLHRGFAASAIAGLAIPLGGCGGDEPARPSPDQPAPLTKREFLFEADRICFAVESQIEAAADDLSGSRDPDPAQVRRVVKRIVVPKLRSEVNAIRLLEPPPADRAEVERILAATERGAQALRLDPLAVLDGVPAALRRAERLARAYGSSECGLR